MRAASPTRSGRSKLSGWSATGALELSILGTSDKITINGFFYQDDPANAYNGVQQIKFTDGGTICDGGADDDLLYGEAGSDTLRGGIGNDRIDGGNENDTLDGGLGNDTLIGGTGNNVYEFGRGDGQDLIQYSQDATAGKLSTFQFKAGVAPTDVQLRKVADTALGGAAGALEISIAGTTDKVVVNGFFYGNNPANLYNGVQQVKFSNGVTWDLATILSKASGGSSALASQRMEAAVIRTPDQRKRHHARRDTFDKGVTEAREQTHYFRTTSVPGLERFGTSPGRTLLDSQVQGLVSAMAAFSPPASGHSSLPSFRSSHPIVSVSDLTYDTR